MPNIGRGGPGLKKKFLSDSEIDEKYLDTSEDKLKCDKCTKKFLQDDKTTFREHIFKPEKYAFQYWSGVLLVLIYNI